LKFKENKLAVISTGVSVGTAATLISGPSPDSRLIYVQNGDEDALVYIGGSNVSAANGILASASNPNVFQVSFFDELFAISDTADTPVKVLEVK
jgi:hypothetical protein